MLQDLSVGLAERYQEGQKKESPVELTDSPMPDFGNNSPSSGPMAFALTSSVNKDDQRPKAVPITNLPIDDTIYGPASGESFVNVYGPMIDMSDTGGLDASNGADDLKPEPESTPPNESATAPGESQPRIGGGISCLITAFLNTIAWAEGSNYRTIAFGVVKTSPMFPHLVGKRNVRIPGVGMGAWPADHPNIGVQAGRWYTHAAGRYQIMPASWRDLGFGGLPFTPENQDAWAATKLARLGVDLDNNSINDAIHRAGGTWCSLPGAWGACRTQPHKSLEQFVRKYNDAKSGC